MVPRDPRNSLFSGRLASARTWHPSPRDVRRFAPPCRFSTAGLRCSATRQRATRVEVSGSNRPFARPRRPRPFRRFRNGVNVPGLTLRRSRRNPTNPLTPSSLPPRLAGRRGTSTLETRNSLGRRRSRPLPTPSLPFGGFRPLRIEALRAARCLETYPSGKPDFPLLPGRRATLNHSAKPDQRARFAIFRRARCSSKSLGTRTIMRLVCFGVNEKTQFR